jgi:hypothetical protein
MCDSFVQGPEHLLLTCENAQSYTQEATCDIVVAYTLVQKLQDIYAVGANQLSVLAIEY